MKILIKSVDTLDISRYMSLLQDKFIIEKIIVEENEWLEPDEDEKYYTRYYITLDSIDDLIKLKNILRRELVIYSTYYTPMFDEINEDVIIIYDGYLE